MTKRFNISTAKKYRSKIKGRKVKDQSISTVAMLDAFVLNTISGLDVKMLLSYIKYVSKFTIKFISSLDNTREAN